MVSQADSFDHADFLSLFCKPCTDCLTRRSQVLDHAVTMTKCSQVIVHRSTNMLNSVFYVLVCVRSCADVPCNSDTAGGESLPDFSPPSVLTSVLFSNRALLDFY